MPARSLARSSAARRAAGALRRRLAAFALGAGALLGATRAFGQAARDRGLLAAQQWTTPSAPNDCVDAAQLARLVEALLERPVMVPRGSADVVLLGRFEPDAPRGGSIARMSLSTADGRTVGTREVRSPATRCGDLTDSVALVVALMIDLPREHVVVHLSPPVPRPPATRWQLRVGAGAAAGVGWVPFPSVGARVSAELSASAGRPRSSRAWRSRRAARPWSWALRPRRCFSWAGPSCARA